MFNDFYSSSNLLPDSHLYRFFRFVPTGEKETRIRNGKPVEVSLNQKEYYSEKDVAEFDLEEYSKLLPMFFPVRSADKNGRNNSFYE